MSDQQLVWDLDDARSRLARIAGKQEQRDHLRELVRELEGKLSQAKRRLKEVTWDLETLMRANQLEHKQASQPRPAVTEETPAGEAVPPMPPDPRPLVERTDAEVAQACVEAEEKRRKGRRKKGES